MQKSLPVLASRPNQKGESTTYNAAPKQRRPNGDATMKTGPTGAKKKSKPNGGAADTNGN